MIWSGEVRGGVVEAVDDDVVVVVVVVRGGGNWKNVGTEWEVPCRGTCEMLEVLGW